MRLWSLSCTALCGAGGSARAKGTDGSGRSRHYFDGLQDRFPGTEVSNRGRGSEGSGSGSGRNLSDFVQQTSQPVAIPSEKSFSEALPGPSKAPHAKDNTEQHSKPRSKDGVTKADQEKDNMRLLGTIDTREMKELMRSLNFTKYALHTNSSSVA